MFPGLVAPDHAGRADRLGHLGRSARGRPRRRCDADRRDSRGRRIPRRAGTRAQPGTGAQLGGGDRDLSRRPRALAQPRRFQPPAPALRDPFQAQPPLSRHQLPQRPAALAARTGRRSLRRGPRTHPDQLRRSRAARAAGPPRARQSRGRPARPGLRQDQRAGGHARSRRPGSATRSGSIAPS